MLRQKSGVKFGGYCFLVGGKAQFIILTTKCFGKAKASSYQHILAEVIWESPKPLRIEYRNDEDEVRNQEEIGRWLTPTRYI